jgi:hypothetical protein
MGQNLLKHHNVVAVAIVVFVIIVIVLVFIFIATTAATGSISVYINRGCTYFLKF